MSAYRSICWFKVQKGSTFWFEVKNVVKNLVLTAKFIKISSFYLLTNWCWMQVTLYLTRPSADEHSGGLAVVPSKLNCLTSSTTSASSPSSPCFTTNGPSNGSKRRQKAAEPVAIHTVLTSSSKDSGSPRNLRFLGPVCWRPVSSDPPSCHPEAIFLF